MLLETLLTHSDASGLALVEDSWKCSASVITENLLHSLLRFLPPASLLVVVSIEHGVEWHKVGIARCPSQQASVALIDCHTDPIGWIGPSPPSPSSEAQNVPSSTASSSSASYSSPASRTFTKLADLQLLQSVILDVAKTAPVQPSPSPPSRSNSPSRVAIFIDSLSYLLTQHSTPSICRMLNDLLSFHTADRVVFLVLGALHSDLHSDRSVAALRHLAATVVTVSPPPPISSSGTSPSHCVCDVLQKRPSGKVHRNRWYFRLESRKAVSMSVDAKTQKEVSKAAEGMPVLPFNVAITDDQKRIRDAVVERGHTMAEELEQLVEDVEEDTVEDPDDDLDI